MPPVTISHVSSLPMLFLWLSPLTKLNINDLKSKFPEIAAEWHPIKNNDLMPDNIVYGSNKDVWWMCENKHEWHTRIVKRTARGHGCPYCSGRRKLSPDDIII